MVNDAAGAVWAFDSPDQHQRRCERTTEIRRQMHCYGLASRTDQKFFSIRTVAWEETFLPEWRIM